MIIDHFTFTAFDRDPSIVQNHGLYHSSMKITLHEDKVTRAKINKYTGINKYSGKRYYRNKVYTTIFKFKKLNDGVEYLVSYEIKNNRIKMHPAEVTLDRLNGLNPIGFNVTMSRFLSLKYPQYSDRPYSFLIAKSILPGLITDDMVIGKYLSRSLIAINRLFICGSPVRKLNLRELTDHLFGSYSRDKMKFTKKLLANSSFDDLLSWYDVNVQLSTALSGLGDKFIRWYVDSYVYSPSVSRFIVSDLRARYADISEPLEDLMMMIFNKTVDLITEDDKYYIPDIVRGISILLGGGVSFGEVKTIIMNSRRNTISSIHDSISEASLVIKNESLKIPFTYTDSDQVFTQSGFKLPESPKALKSLGDRFSNCVFSYHEDVRHSTSLILEDPKTESCIELVRANDKLVLSQVLGRFNEPLEPLSFWDVVNRIESVVDSPLTNIEKCWGFQPRPEKEVSK